MFLIILVNRLTALSSPRSAHKHGNWVRGKLMEQGCKGCSNSENAGKITGAVTGAGFQNRRCKCGLIGECSPVLRRK
jgi:hypothetical protein